MIWIGLAAREIGIGARLALIGDQIFGHRLDLSVGSFGGFRLRRSAAQVNVVLPACKRGTSGLKIFRSIDPERHRINHRHVDAHAGFEKAQLLQPFAHFQG